MAINRLLLICTLSFTLLGLGACHPGPNSSQSLAADPSYSASLSADGHYALISSQEGIRLWDLRQGAIKYQWAQGSAANDVIATDISANSEYAVTLSRDSVALWKIADGRAAGWWSLPAVAQAVAVADNGQLLVGLADGAVMSLTPTTGVLVKFLGHSEKVNSVALSADGRLALTGANDATALLWRPQDAQVLRRWQMDSRVLKVALSHSGSLSLVSDSTGNADIWHNDSGKLASSLAIVRRQMNFSAARFIQQEQALLTGTPARELSLWQVDSGKKVANWQVSLPKKPLPQSAVVYSVSESDNGQLQSISSASLLERWSAPTQR